MSTGLEERLSTLPYSDLQILVSYFELLLFGGCISRDQPYSEGSHKELERLDHISPISDEQSTYKKDTFTELVLLVGLLEDKPQAVDIDQLEDNAKSFDISEAVKTVNPDDSSSSDDEVETNKGIHASTPQRIKMNTVGMASLTSSPNVFVKSTLVCQWRLQFSGDRMSNVQECMSVHAFLERLEEFYRARG
ncbi:hypothetical protein HHI36_008696 [Cryptolaemus montrouzieri]|uniref:Uncharacterized protein n=1 Tax=Cryptolaemus montrouzieri TaxID=559131 RepID=A0ABD2MTQ5_9CUCU